jgi:hypothetical protein
VVCDGTSDRSTGVDQETAQWAFSIATRSPTCRLRMYLPVAPPFGTSFGWRRVHRGRDSELLAAMDPAKRCASERLG